MGCRTGTLFYCKGKKGIPFASKPSPIPGGALNPPGQQEKEGNERNARNSFKEYQPSLEVSLYSY
jgi:hypothetical protein